MRVVLTFAEGTDPLTVEHMRGMLHNFANSVEARWLPYGVRATFEEDESS